MKTSPPVGFVDLRGEAEFEREDDDDQLELELGVEVEKAVPGSVHGVARDGVVVAQITIGNDGHGRIRMATHQEDVGDLPIPEDFPASASADSEVTVGTILRGNFSMHGDLNEDRSVDSGDVDMLFAAIRTGSSDNRYDLDGDTSIDGGDVRYLVQGVIGTVFGDANMDGIFDSSDLVAVFQAGRYEDPTPENSTWESGDWNGDRKFDSADIVLAFQAGGHT